MRRVARGLVVLFLGLAALAAVVLAYVRFGLPRLGDTPALQIAADPALAARGAYLAENVAICVDCHSKRDFSRYSGPVQPGSVGAGGEVFGHALGLPGELVASNITPAAIGGWSDGELARAITEGVTPDGRALFPFMNYPGYSQLCRRDVQALVTYLRGLQPIASDLPRTQLDFPLNLLVRTFPKPAAISDKCPDPNDGPAYGKYLVTVAGCADCHTRREAGAPIAGQEFAGGMRFALQSGYVAHSANITPDVDTGIGRWTKAMFVARFAAYRDAGAIAPVHGTAANTPMPWQLFSGMTDQDLGAIYDYLRTQKAVRTQPAEPLAAR